jgi:iron complex outermembrane receptor protein
MRAASAAWCRCAASPDRPSALADDRTGARTPRPRLSLAAMLPALMCAGTAFGQSATPGSVVVLEPISIEGSAASPADSAAERLAATPGGTGVVLRDDLEGRANVKISDALSTAQGVVVQDFFGGNDQPRIQIRGSGLQQNPVERGILFLQDGLPLNRADGSYIVGLADARQAEFIEINRGYTANRLGASVLGGALNLVSPTGATARGIAGRAATGSFGHVDLSAEGGFLGENVDGFLVGSFARRDGFRDFNSSERAGLNGNAGIEVNEIVRTRFFAGFTDLGFDVAGPLPKALLEDDPSQNFTGPRLVPGPPPVAVNPGPNVLRDRPRRDATQFRIGNRTTAELDEHVLDVALGLSHTDDSFRFPISSGIRETEGGDVTIVGRYAYHPNSDDALPLLEVTSQAMLGAADRRYFLNDAGERGALFGKGELDASTLTLTATGNLPLGRGFTLSPSLSFTYATRDFDDTFPGATRPTIAFNPANPGARLPGGAVPAEDTSYSRRYTGLSPSLALGWRPDEAHFLFAAASRSFEPPTHDDLIATVNGTPNSSAGRPEPGNPALAAAAFRTPDLEAQTATTLEAGWRGKLGGFALDTVVYHSWIEDELLSLRDVTGASLGAVNADKTRHFGVELGVAAAITRSLSGRVAYTFQDFRFADDPVRGDNRLAGAPPHVIGLDLGYKLTPSLNLGTGLAWRPAKTPVDNMNTLYADPFATVDLRARYEPVEGVSLFGEIRNLFDETYAASTLIVDQARSDQAVFIPGDGRAVYVGLSARF